MPDHQAHGPSLLSDTLADMCTNHCAIPDHRRSVLALMHTLVLLQPPEGKKALLSDWIVWFVSDTPISKFENSNRVLFFFVTRCWKSVKCNKLQKQNFLILLYYPTESLSDFTSRNSCGLSVGSDFSRTSKSTSFKT